MSLAAADQANQQMVDRLIAEGALWSPALIAAFRATPRHGFLDRVFQFHRKSERWREILVKDLTPEHVRLIYSDRALITHLSSLEMPRPVAPISSSSQPSLMAQMLEDLKLAPGLDVLEIGAGTGYNAALMAAVVGPVGRVTSVDVDRDVLAEAWDHLRALPDRRVELRQADGRQGLAEAAPFDRIMVTAATMDLEPAWLEQLDERGLLEVPLALAPGLAFIVRGSVSQGVFHGRLTRAAYFMALRDEDEVGSEEFAPVPDAGELHSVPAPWADWFNRKRPRINWLGFSQSLAFYGLIRGLNVHFRTMERHSAFGLSQGKEALCWFGQHEWHVNGEAGRNLGWNIWRAFLTAGGPWPTEFRLKASRSGGLVPSRRESYRRQGSRCQHLWELIEPRDRPTWI